jgi:hypothetical protein
MASDSSRSRHLQITSDNPFTVNPRLIWIIALWGLAATAAGILHLLARLPAACVPLLLASLVAGLNLCLWRTAWLRPAAQSLGVRAILCFHLLRFVGFYFIWLQTQGRLPVEFAERAGWGDVAAAAGALVLLFWAPGFGFRRALGIWNWFGMIDLLVVVGTATWLNLSRPGSMREIAAFPLALVPLWAVPLLMTSHFVLMRARVRDGSQGPAQGT